MARLIALILCLFCSSTIIAQQYVNRYYGIVEICFCFDSNTISPAPPKPGPAPAPAPSPYKCEKCKDTKWIIHGDGHKSPCPNCNTGEVLAENNLVVSPDFNYVIINNKRYKRKAPMANNGIWIAIDKWKVCYSGRCVIYTITDQNNLGLNMGDYNVY